jgi:molybdenum cofactor cytidylyltransferase
MFNRYSVIIPAAGQSIRMGIDKALLPFGNGTCFAENIMTCFSQSGCNKIVLVIKQAQDISVLKDLEFITVINDNIKLGRSYSIYLGLQSVPEGNSCFIHNIDNPFLELPLLDCLLEEVRNEGYAVPVWKGKSGHPVILGKGVADHIRRQPCTMDFREQLKGFSRIEVPYHDKRILWNINTPGDYLQFVKEAGSYFKKM